jgi:hypothetical protein
MSHGWTTAESKKMDEDWLRELEESLLRPESRRDVEALSKVIAPDFREVGASGHTYDRAAILQSVPNDPSPESYVISDFVVTELDIHVAMVSYRLEASYADEEAPRRTIRTSLWRLAEGGWQVFFHQGTPAAG